MRLRGLCAKSKFDKKYTFGDDSDQGIYFQGERGTNITTNMTKNELENGANKFVLIHTSLEYNHKIEIRKAWVDSPEGTFLLGRRQILIEKDEDCEPLKDNYTTEVIFSTCHDDEFTCNDGVCIDMALRCNNIKNCPNDMSDEAGCTMLVIPPSYRRDYAPSKLMNMGMLSRLILLYLWILQTFLK